MHRINSLDETADTDYNVGTALAAEGKTFAHVQTEEQMQGYQDWDERNNDIMAGIEETIASADWLSPFQIGYEDADSQLAFAPEVYFTKFADQMLYAFGFNTRRPGCRIAADWIEAYEKQQDEESYEYNAMANDAIAGR